MLVDGMWKLSDIKESKCTPKLCSDLTSSEYASSYIFSKDYALAETSSKVFPLPACITSTLLRFSFNWVFFSYELIPDEHRASLVMVGCER